ncbi:dipeptidase [Sulfitobacter sp. 20_GPM-1509m]|uniref:dipeptidase n=1 Tax=Sulfitobacter sp. 20_GPM-1509m TaxID=1380367 RepID=UPI00056A6BFA|nr:membrane dipeptidase [Sulfitobacter sp. 20_GPM-1509m]
MGKQMIFDGHNDALMRLWKHQGDPVAHFETDAGHINATACRAGGMGGGFFAIYCPASRMPHTGSTEVNAVELEPLDDPLDQGWALQAAMGQAGIALQLAAAGQIEIVTRPDQLGQAFMGDAVACVLHLEGAECIDADLLALDVLYGVGLRSLGPVWSRNNIFGHGVPFAHFRDPDLGPGLTEDGKRLAKRCGELGIMLDTSHITLKGFEDIADMGQPVVATHSNAWSLCPSSRNLTDAQLQVIAQSGGIAGLNFAPPFLSDEGWKTGRVGLEACIRHLEYMIERLGEDHVALGSDFDGARMPDGIASAADLPVLVKAMEDAGFGAEVIAKICCENWLAFLGRHLEKGA